MSHDGDLKGFGFGFQRRLGPVITPAMFPPQKASRAASRRGARLQPSPVTCWGPAGGGLGGAARPRRPPAVRGLRDGAGGPGRAGPGWAEPGRAVSRVTGPAWRRSPRRCTSRLCAVGRDNGGEGEPESRAVPGLLRRRQADEG